MQASDFELRASRNIDLDLQQDLALHGFIGGVSGFEPAKNLDIHTSGDLTVPSGIFEAKEDIHLEANKIDTHSGAILISEELHVDSQKDLDLHTSVDKLWASSDSGDIHVHEADDLVVKNAITGKWKTDYSIQVRAGGTLKAESVQQQDLGGQGDVVLQSADELHVDDIDTYNDSEVTLDAKEGVYELNQDYAIDVWADKVNLLGPYYDYHFGYSRWGGIELNKKEWGVQLETGKSTMKGMEVPSRVDHDYVLIAPDHSGDLNLNATAGDSNPSLSVVHLPTAKGETIDLEADDHLTVLPKLDVGESGEVDLHAGGGLAVGKSIRAGKLDITDKGENEDVHLTTRVEDLSVDMGKDSDLTVHQSGDLHIGSLQMHGGDLVITADSDVQIDSVQGEVGDIHIRSQKGDIQIDDLEGSSNAILHAPAGKVTGSIEADTLNLTANGKVDITEADGMTLSRLEQKHTSSPVKIQVDKGTLKVGSDVSAGPKLALMANDLDIAGQLRRAGSTFHVQPPDSDDKIVLGENSSAGNNAFHLNNKELSGLHTGSDHMVVGSDQGSHEIHIGDSDDGSSKTNFNHGLTLKNPKQGGEIYIHGTVTGGSGSSLAVHGSGSTMYLNDSEIEISGNQEYNDSLQVSGESSIHSHGSIQLGGKAEHNLNGDSQKGEDKLSLRAGQDGDIVINTRVGDQDPLEDLTIHQARDIIFKSGVSLDGGLHIEQARNVTFRDGVTAHGDVHIQASGEVVFEDQLNLDQGGQLHVEGAERIKLEDDVHAQGHVNLQADQESGEVVVKGDLTGEGEIEVQGSGNTTHLVNNNLSLSGNQKYHDALQVTGDVLITADDHLELGKDPQHSINGDSKTGADTLIINNHHGEHLVVNSAIGKTDPLEGLTVQEAQDIDFNNILNIDGDLRVEQAEDVTFANQNDLQGNLDIIAQGDVDFENAMNLNDLSIKGADVIRFQDRVVYTGQLDLNAEHIYGKDMLVHKGPPQESPQDTGGGEKRPDTGPDVQAEKPTERFLENPFDRVMEDMKEGGEQAGQNRFQTTMDIAKSQGVAPGSEYVSEASFLSGLRAEQSREFQAGEDNLYAEFLEAQDRYFTPAGEGQPDSAYTHGEGLQGSKDLQLGQLSLGMFGSGLGQSSYYAEDMYAGEGYFRLFGSGMFSKPGVMIQTRSELLEMPFKAVEIPGLEASELEFSEGERISLSWSGVSSADKYKVLIMRDNVVVATKWVEKGTKCNLDQDLIPGSYQWQVHGWNMDSGIAVKSRVGELLVQ